MERAVQGTGAHALPSQSLIETAPCAQALCTPPTLMVLPMSAAGFVAPCQDSTLGGQDQCLQTLGHQEPPVQRLNRVIACADATWSGSDASPGECFPPVCALRRPPRKTRARPRRPG